MKMRVDIIEKFEKLLNAEDFNSVKSEIRIIVEIYKDLLHKERIEEDKLKQLNIENGEVTKELTVEEAEIRHQNSILDVKIEEKILEFRDKIAKEKKRKEDEEKQNLLVKKTLLKDFKDLVENEENISKAFERRKELSENWRNIGKVPKNEYDNIHSEYSRLNELFNYNINIFKDLKDNDLKQNYSLKNQVIYKLSELIEKNNKTEIESKNLLDNLNMLISEWDEIGATYQDKWEELKTKYWDKVIEVRNIVNDRRKEIEKEYEANLVVKQSLIDELKSFNSIIYEKTSEWSEKTTEIANIQANWKKVGRVPPDNYESIWEEFRKECDMFFHNKTKFFNEKSKLYEDNANLKLEIIKKSEEILNPANWKNATKQLIEFQSKWKEIGFAGNKDKALWTSFRQKCDEFFKNKEKFFADRENIEIDNLNKKKLLIEKIQNLEINNQNKNESLQLLKDLQTEFNNIGNVPFKQKDEVYQNFKNIVDQKYKGLKMNGDEEDLLRLKDRIETFTDRKELLNFYNEQNNSINKLIVKIKKDTKLMETNMSFFGKSFKNNEFTAEIDKKININNNKIKKLETKLNILKNHILKSDDNTK